MIAGFCVNGWGVRGQVACRPEVRTALLWKMEEMVKLYRRRDGKGTRV